jgi:hypothetical protein
MQITRQELHGRTWSIPVAKLCEELGLSDRGLAKLCARHDIPRPPRGQSNLENGQLLAAAEGQFDAFVTTDQNLRYQQNLQGRRLAIVVLPTTNWMEIRNHLPEVTATMNGLLPGDYRELRWTT